MKDTDERPEPRLPFPPAVLAMMAAYWRRRVVELEAAIQAETRPDVLDGLAAEWQRATALAERVERRAA